MGVWGNSTPTTSWRPRKRVGFCPILNFRGLNPYLLVEKFRLETMTSILRDLCPGMWMVSLYLKDAYFHVPIRPSHRNFLRFALKDQYGVLHVYQWGALPFGLATAPRLFTKLLAPAFWLTRAICEQARKALAPLAVTPIYVSSTSLYGKSTEYFSKV